MSLGKTTHFPVLIVGAGPTGLVLALWLTKIGIKVRLIDKTSGPGTTSRAIVVHARTLEFYRQLGIADEVVAQGFNFPNANLWVNHRLKAQIPIGILGQGISPYPYVLVFPQDQQEELLIKHLKKLGVEVERETELLSFQINDQKIEAKIRNANGEIEDCQAEYLAGCDGAHSLVREKIGMKFEGATYADLYYVADVVGSGPALNGELHASLDQAEFLAIFPMKDKGHARLIGVLRDMDKKKTIEWKDVNPRLLKEMDIEVKDVRWFSTYHVHHRVAPHFQKGPVFLLGDAGHIHSPVGGQGMNTGIGDAVNLAWKLGEVLKGKASPKILESYEVERIAFARRLVRTTDQAFQFISSRGAWARFVRTQITPRILPLIMRFRFVKKFLFRTISQTGITYRHSPISQGRACRIESGDRLPWIKSVDNFAALRTLSWQIHIYETEKKNFESSEIPVLQYQWNDEMDKKGLLKGKIYLIRPDGYIGLIANEHNEIKNYLKRIEKKNY